MNKENMLRVADAIENENLAKFDMRIWHAEKFEQIDTGVRSCGTAACVGGTAMAIMGKDRLWRHEVGAKEHYSMDEMNVRPVADWLGLPYREAYDLFSASEIGIQTPGVRTTYEEKYDYINQRKHLVPDALRYMAETGDTSWLNGFEYAECVQKEKNKK